MSREPDHPNGYGQPYDGHHPYSYQEPYPHPDYHQEQHFETQPPESYQPPHDEQKVEEKGGGDSNEKEGESSRAARKAPSAAKTKERTASDKENDDKAEERRLSMIQTEDEHEKDPVVIAQIELISKSTPSTELEIALAAALKRKEEHARRLASEIIKLKQFISKRKQTYKRKRKDDGAPTRALSAYNIFIQDRFARLAKENEKALKSEDKDATMKRVPPASLVAKTGNQWKELSAEEKAKYEERAKTDRKRYDDQMAQYQAPDKHAGRKRNKTGYNMFFSAHVLRLKQTESGVPSERGSVARLVGTAWKLLSSEEKTYYEREADKHNGLNPVKEGEEEDDDEEIKRQQMEYHMQAHNDMHMHAPMPQHDPRHHPGYYPPHMYGPPPPYGHYDYSQHHQRHQRAQGYQQQYPPARHPYDG